MCMFFGMISDAIISNREQIPTVWLTTRTPFYTKRQLSMGSTHSLYYYGLFDVCPVSAKQTLNGH